MDVMLDTNILERNFKLNSNAFANLFAYLRRTNSKLVLSKLVWDEVRIRYAERLKAGVDALEAASDTVADNSPLNCLSTCLLG
jgi:PIN domain